MGESDVDLVSWLVGILETPVSEVLQLVENNLSAGTFKRKESSATRLNPSQSMHSVPRMQQPQGTAEPQVAAFAERTVDPDFGSRN